MKYGTPAATQPGLKPLQRTVEPVAVWAVVGVLALAVIASVLAIWISGPNFKPTAPPPGEPPASLMLWVHLLQIFSPITLLVFLWAYLIRPWMRSGQITLDGMLLVSWLAVYFQDALMNYLTPQLLWSSYFINFGSWSLGSFPTWISPHGNLLPEPLVAIGATYGSLGFWPAVGACAVMRSLHRRFPRMSTLELILIGWAAAVAMNASSELLLLRTGVYAYPGSIRAFSFFPGTPYQFPLTSGICFGAVMAATATLRYFKDDTGRTWVERGVERLTLSPTRQTLLRFFALFGFVQLSMFLLFTVPIQWVGLISDPWPELPAHLTNGLCAYGPAADQCPGPGIPIFRP
jgi:hypothetical protein